MTVELDQLYRFICHTARLREVERHNRATSARFESVAEHSWHLALICWLLRSRLEQEYGAELDLEKMIKMCLMHDLVEIDTGDPSAWFTDAGGLTDSSARRDKAAVEDECARRRFAELPSPLGDEMLALWREHEAAESIEALLVRAVDRLNPALMRHLTGQGWGDVDADTLRLDALQLPRVSVSETILAIYRRVRDDAVAAGQLRP